MKLTIKNQAKVKIKNKDNMCAIHSNLAFLHPPRVNPKRVSNYKTKLDEIKTDGIDLTDGIKVDDIGKLEELNIQNINVFELNEDKTLTQVYAPTNMNKNENNNEDNH